MMMMIWSCWWCEAERDLSFNESSCLLFLFFWIFHQNQQKLTTKRRNMKERSLKSVNERRGFFRQNRFFSLWNNCQKVKKRPQTHRRETFFPNTTKTTQHQSSCSLLLLTRFDHHHRSSRRMSPPNLLDLLLDHRRRWKSARWGWKKVRYCFRFRRLAS